MNGKRVLLTVILLVTVLSWSAPGVMAQNETMLTVAFIGAADGTQAQADRLLYQAAVLAAEQINEPEGDNRSRGVAGPDGDRYVFEVVYYEADGDDDAPDTLSEAADDGVIAALVEQVGYVETILDAGDPQVPLLYGAPDAPASDSAYAFHLSADLDAWTRAAADYLATERHLRRIAAVAADTETAQDELNIFVEAVENAGSEIVAELSHPADSEDLSADAEEIRDADAEAVFAWTLDAQAVLLLEALRDAGWDGLIVYSGLDRGFVERAGPELADGMFGPTSWSAAAYDAYGQSFVAEYEARWGTTPPDEAAAYYDAMYLLAQAVAGAGDDPDGIARELGNISGYRAVQGIYDAAHTDDLLLIQVGADGELREAARYEDGACVNCPDTWWPDTSDETVEGYDVAVLALISTMGGATEARGRHAEQGATLAIEEINDAGGVIGPDGVRYTLTLQSLDAATPDEAATAMQTAAEMGASVLLGPDYNAHIMPNLSLAAGLGLPVMTSATDPWMPVREPADFVLQMRPNDRALAEAATEYLLDVREFTRFATVTVRTEYAFRAKDAIEDAISASDGGRVVLSLEHDVDGGDFADMARQISDSGAEAVLAWTIPPALESLLTELDALGWDGVLAYGYLTPELAGDLQPSPTVELIGPVNWWPVAGDWVGRDFVDSYETRFGESPSSLAAAYYDAVYLAAHAIREVGPAPDDVRSWLVGIEQMHGVQGVYRPAEYGQGEMSHSVLILGLRDEGALELARYDGETCLIGCGQTTPARP